MPNIAVLGASGHARVIIDILKCTADVNIVGCIAPQAPEHDNGCPYLGADEDIATLWNNYHIDGAVIAVGDNSKRAEMVSRIKTLLPEIVFYSAIHPQAYIANDVEIGEGSVVMAGVVVNSASRIGRFCILNTRSSLDHDCSMGNFSSLAPGVCCGGDCHIEQFSAINIGSVLIQGIRVGQHSVVGAGSLLLNSLPSHVLAYGHPAKIIRQRKEGESYF